ncbi:hypothetical protein [Pseudomonas phage vB_PaeM_PS119XW]|uniref:Uncharacterized protein n=2 Tax=root TaxID=1 RepID=A0A5C1K7P0_9CAUD|nr:hypothetical protein PP933_gp050 [Pseudomonas phage vB_PaeM_PS119XW]QEM41779.1 hypothetical protein [Pseudomonas phage vB_PaeM_PS119XW]
MMYNSNPTQNKEVVSFPFGTYNVLDGNLCGEIAQPGASRFAKICTLGLDYPYMEQALLLDYNMYCHFDVALRQAFAPEGKLITDSYSGYTLAGYLPDELQELDDLIANFMKEHEELSKDQLETLWAGMTLVRRSWVLHGTRSTTSQSQRLWTQYNNLIRKNGELPGTRHEALMKKIPTYDTECNEMPKFDGIVTPPEWLSINDVFTKGFKPGELQIISSPVLDDIPKTNSRLYMYNKLRELGHNNIMLESTDTESEMSTDLLEQHLSKMETVEAEPTEIDSIESRMRTRRKKKKGAKRSKHITNCKSGMVKALMGGSILAKLSQIQTQTQDGIKREILKNHTLSSFVETVSGEAIPEYQKRLLDKFQERADSKPLKPVEEVSVQDGEQV